MSSPGRVLLPSLRATLGDWVYYVAKMPFREIAARVRFAQDMYKGRALNERLQRDITDRADDISDYLLRQKQRFFNAIIVGIFQGKPEWYPIEVRGSALIKQKDLPVAVQESIGVLSLTGAERMFALDGQHRVEGIRRALASKPDLGDEEQTVIFVGHSESVSGKERTRRLFSTLNRYAKPVKLGEIIILDEDDAIAVTTRRLIGSHPFLSRDNVIRIGKTKNIPRTDKKCLTSIETLYQSLAILFIPETGKAKKKRLQFRPSVEELDKLARKAAEYVDLLVKYFTPLQKLRVASAEDEPAATYRHAEGGHVLFRPVGFLSVARAARRCLDLGMSLKQYVAKLSRMPMDLTERPWGGLLWNQAANKMITRKANQEIASLWIAYMAGIDLRRVTIKKAPMSLSRLKQIHADEIGVDPSEIRAPRKA